MSKKDQVIQKLVKNKVLTVDDVEEIGLSERARQQYLKEIRDNENDLYPFSVEDRKQCRNKITGWFLKEVDSREFDSFKRAFKIQTDFRFQAESMLKIESSDFQNTILSDTYSPKDSSSVFQHIMIEIRNKRRISIDYKDYRGEKINRYENIIPLFLKENRYGRFYLIASISRTDGNIDLSNIETFGLDRVESVSTTKKEFSSHDSHKKIKRFFANLIGTHIPRKPHSSVNYLKDEPPITKVRVTNFQARYIDSIPIHESQVVVDSEEEGFKTIMFKVWPTIEFVAQLVLQNNLLNNNVGDLSHPECTAIKVLEPEWMQNWVEAISKRILRDHSKEEALINKLSDEIEKEVKDGIGFDYIG